MSEVLTIVVDASPWDIGGVLLRNSAPFNYFADRIQIHDLHRFRAVAGGSSFTALFECLASLVAIKLWRQGRIGLHIALRNDSLSALHTTAPGMLSLPSSESSSPSSWSPSRT